MIYITDLKRLDGESEEQYLWRIGQLVDSGKIENWKSINNIINEQLGIEEDSYRDESSFRKKYQAAKKFYDEVFSKREPDEYQKELQIQKRELEKLKIQFRDERNAWQKINYIEGRVEEKLNKLEEEIMSQGKDLFEVTSPTIVKSDNDLLVILSDLHIGAEYYSFNGSFNSDIAKDRLMQYLQEILAIKETYKSQNCYVSILGDNISGNIHTSISVTNRENVIEQIMKASSLVSSFIYELSKNFNEVTVNSVNGNHSRIAKKDEALKDERLDSLILWYSKGKLSHINNVHFEDEQLDSTVANFTIRGLTYTSVHGDNDALTESAAARLMLWLGFKPDVILYGHKHYPAMTDVAGIKLVQTGSLCGSGDDYTNERRLKGKASQTVLVCTEKGIKAYIPVELD